MTAVTCGPRTQFSGKQKIDSLTSTGRNLGGGEMRVSTVLKLRKKIEKILIEREDVLDRIMNAIAAADEDVL
jgi:hypothetical protein